MTRRQRVTCEHGHGLPANGHESTCPLCRPPRPGAPMTDRETATVEMLVVEWAGALPDEVRDVLRMSHLADLRKRVVEALAARRESPATWRKEPPTVEEVRACNRWRWRIERVGVGELNRGVARLFVGNWPNGEEYVGGWNTPVLPGDLAEGLIMEFAPCLPPRESPAPGLVEAARSLLAWCLDADAWDGYHAPDIIEHVRGALRGALPKEPATASVAAPVCLACSGAPEHGGCGGCSGGECGCQCRAPASPAVEAATRRSAWTDGSGETFRCALPLGHKVVDSDPSTWHDSNGGQSWQSAAADAPAVEVRGVVTKIDWSKGFDELTVSLVEGQDVAASALIYAHSVTITPTTPTTTTPAPKPAT